MTGLSRWFKKSRDQNDKTKVVPEHQDLLEQMDRLQKGSESPHPLTRARLWHRIATSVADAGMRDDAKVYFGRAIDGYVEAGCFDAAAALCRRFIGLYPDVVRAHCTLAFLSLGLGDIANASEEIIGYVLAAKRARTTPEAVSRLLLMLEVTDDRTIHQQVGAILKDLGYDGPIERGTGAANANADAQLERLMNVALLNRQELLSRPRAEDRGVVELLMPTEKYA